MHYLNFIISCFFILIYIFMNNKDLFVLGMKHGIPIVFGYIPVGIAYAVSALQAGFSSFETVLMSIVVYSGAGQVLGVGMTAQGASILAIAIGTFLINFRYFIMSACVFNRVPEVSLIKKIWTSFYVTDETFALFTTADSKIAKMSYIAGIIVLTYSSWVLGAVIGVFANSILPDSVTAALGIALYALFIALIMPGCKKNSKIFTLVIFSALFNTFLSRFIDMSWAIVTTSLFASLLGAIFIKERV